MSSFWDLVQVAASVVTVSLFMVPCTLQAQSGDDYVISWSTIDAGGGTFSSGGSYELGGTIGQPDAFLVTGGAYVLIGGFWGGGVADNTPPSVTISFPLDGATYPCCDPILFEATASDAEDGDLTPSLSWISSLDGAIGSGGSFTASLSTGIHGITASVTDSGGLPGSDFVTVAVEVQLPGPTLRILDAFAAAGEAVSVSIEFIGAGNDIAAVAFSEDFDETCLSFDPSDGDGDGLPDAVAFDVPPGFAASAVADLGDPDGEIDVLIFDLPPVDTALADGVLAAVTFETQCVPFPGETLVAPVRFSFDPAPSFGDLLGQSVPGIAVDGAVNILPGERGDCNGDEAVDAGDLTACGLELFDGDAAFWLEVPGGNFAGSPVGCDANADAAVNAGDVSCKGRLIFGLGCGGGAARDPDAGAGRPRLSIPADLPVEPDGIVVVPVRFASSGHAINSVVFSLDIDQALLSFGATDPGAVEFLGVESSVQSVSFQPGDEDGELDFIVADPTAAPVLLADGLLVEIRLRALAPAGELRNAVVFSRDPSASFGDALGRAVPGSAGGIVFADGFESGDTSAWSQVAQ